MHRQLFCLCILLKCLTVQACHQWIPFDLSSNKTASLNLLAVIEDVSDPHGCAKLCLLESSCKAIQHHDRSFQCQLIMGYRHIEAQWQVQGQPGSLLWLLGTKKYMFGKCGKLFSISWRSSKYKSTKKRFSWHSAEKLCHRWNGKLAEFTDDEEIQEVHALLREEKVRKGINELWVHVGITLESASEGGVMTLQWNQSKKPVPLTLLATPPQSYETVGSWSLSNNASVQAVSPNTELPFVCECLSL